MIGDPTVAGDIAEVVGSNTRSDGTIVCVSAVLKSPLLPYDRVVYVLQKAWVGKIRSNDMERIDGGTACYVYDANLRPIRDLDDEETETVEELGLVV